MTLKKPKLIILSDLFGFKHSDWIGNYVDLLKSEFILTIYDSLDLAGIDITNLSKKEIHSQFINYGIENAVNKLLQLEKKKVNILAFSIGGTIAWKGALEDLKTDNLYAVSATRLRYELKKPISKIHLLYGLQDPFIPKSSWFHQMDVSTKIIKEGNHEIYKSLEFTKFLCALIISEKNSSRTR